MAIALHLALVLVLFILLLAFAVIGVRALWRWISRKKGHS
jgi:hypothetical protein